jgi:hypothetical protein
MLKCLLTNVAIIDTCISYKPSIPLIGSTSDHLITFQLSQHHIAMSQTVIYITFPVSSVNKTDRHDIVESGVKHHNYHHNHIFQTERKNK